MIILQVNFVLAAKEDSAFKGKGFREKALFLGDVSDFDDVVEPANERFGEDISNILNDALHIRIPSSKKSMVKVDDQAYKSNNPSIPSNHRPHKPAPPFKFKYAFPNIGDGQGVKKLTCVDGVCEEGNRFKAVDMAGINSTVLSQLNSSLASPDYVVERFAIKFVPERILLDKRFDTLPKYNFQPMYDQTSRSPLNLYPEGSNQRKKRRSTKAKKRKDISNEIIKQKIHEHMKSHVKSRQVQTMQHVGDLKPNVPSASIMQSYLTIGHTDAVLAKIQSTSSTAISESNSGATNEEHQLSQSSSSAMPNEPNPQLSSSAVPNELNPQVSSAPNLAIESPTTKMNPLAWEDSFLKGIYKSKSKDEKSKKVLREGDNISDDNEDEPLSDSEMNEKSKRCIGNCKLKANHTAELHILVRALNGSEYSEAEVLKCLEHHLNESWCLLHYLYRTSTAGLPNLIKNKNTEEGISAVQVTSAGQAAMAIATKENFTYSPLSSTESLSSTPPLSAESLSSPPSSSAESLSSSPVSSAESLSSPPPSSAESVSSSAESLSSPPPSSAESLSTATFSTNSTSNDTSCNDETTLASSSSNITKELSSDNSSLTNVTATALPESANASSLPESANAAALPVSANASALPESTNAFALPESSNATALSESELSKVSSATEYTSALIPNKSSSVNSELIRVCAQMFESKLPQPSTEKYQEAKQKGAAAAAFGNSKTVMGFTLNLPADESVNDLSQSDFLFSSPSCSGNETETNSTNIMNSSNITNGTNAGTTAASVEFSKNVAVAVGSSSSDLQEAKQKVTAAAAFGNSKTAMAFSLNAQKAESTHASDYSSLGCNGNEGDVNSASSKAVTVAAGSASVAGSTKAWLESDKSGEATKVHERKARADDTKLDKPVPEVIQSLEDDLNVINQLQSLLNSLKQSDDEPISDGIQIVRRNKDKKKSQPNSSSSCTSTTSSRATTTVTPTTEDCYGGVPPATQNTSKASNNTGNGSVSNGNKTVQMVGAPLDDTQLKEIIQNATNSLPMGEDVINFPKVDLKTNELLESPVKVGNHTLPEPLPMQLNQINELLQNIHDTYGGTLVHLQESMPMESETRVKRDFDKLSETGGTSSNAQAHAATVESKNEKVNSQISTSKEKRFLFQKRNKPKKKKRKRIWKKLHGRELEQQPFLGRISQNSLSTTGSV